MLDRKRGNLLRILGVAVVALSSLTLVPGLLRIEDRRFLLATLLLVMIPSALAFRLFQPLRDGARPRFASRFGRGFLAAFCVLTLVELALVAVAPRSWSADFGDMSEGQSRAIRVLGWFGFLFQCFEVVLSLMVLPLLGGILAGEAFGCFMHVMERQPRVVANLLGKRRWTIGRVMMLVGLAAIDMAVIRAGYSSEAPRDVAPALAITLPAWNLAAFLLIRPSPGGSISRDRLAARRGFRLGLIGSWVILLVTLFNARDQVGKVFMNAISLTLGDPDALNRLASAHPWLMVPILIALVWVFFNVPLLIAGFVCAAIARRLQPIGSAGPLAPWETKLPEITFLPNEDVDATSSSGSSHPPDQPDPVRGNHASSQSER
jgi:hypothetical protein